jgi:hypothetical protein
VKLDRVLTVNVWRDGPRLGVAELHGVPHIYEAEFDHDGEGYGDTFFLTPIEPGLLALVLQEWQCRLRLEAAARAGEALPAERARREALRREIGGRLCTDPERCRYYSARFRARDPGVAMHGYLVEWRRELRVR